MSSNSLWAMSLSRMKPTTWRWLWTPPFLALVMTFSATGRSALARASVVTMASAAISDATMLANIAFWWLALPPNRLFLRGVPSMALLLGAQRQAALVELHDDLVEGLLAEVRDGQEVVLGLLEQLADRVDLRPLEAVARTLRQVEVLDREVEIGRAGGRAGDLAELEAHGVVAHLGDEAHERAQRVAGGGERLARRDRTVGLDVEHEAIEVGRLLDAGGLHVERDATHGRE